MEHYTLLHILIFLMIIIIICLSIVITININKLTTLEKYNNNFNNYLAEYVYENNKNDFGIMGLNKNINVYDTVADAIEAIGTNLIYNNNVYYTLVYDIKITDTQGTVFKKFYKINADRIWNYALFKLNVNYAFVFITTPHEFTFKELSINESDLLHTGIISIQYKNFQSDYYYVLPKEIQIDTTNYKNFNQDIAFKKIVNYYTSTIYNKYKFQIWLSFGFQFQKFLSDNENFAKENKIPKEDFIIDKLNYMGNFKIVNKNDYIITNRWPFTKQIFYLINFYPKKTSGNQKLLAFEDL